MGRLDKRRQQAFRTFVEIEVTVEVRGGRFRIFGVQVMNIEGCAGETVPRGVI